MLAEELSRCLGCAVPVVDDGAQPGDVELHVGTFRSEAQDALAGAVLEFGATAKVSAPDPAALARACGALVQALGSLPDLRAPYGRSVCRPAGEDCLVLVGKDAEWSAALQRETVQREVVRRAWLVGIGAVYLPFSPAPEVVSYGRQRGVVVAGMSALPSDHVRPLRIEVESADDLGRALRIALPLQREQPTADQLASFQARLARAARATGF
jgi:hypothetical protein